MGFEPRHTFDATPLPRLKDLRGGVRHVLSRVAHDDSGQDIVEYALLGAVIGIASILTWQQLADAIEVAYDEATGLDGTVQGLSACTPDPGGGGC